MRGVLKLLYLRSRSMCEEHKNGLEVHAGIFQRR